MADPGSVSAVSAGDMFAQRRGMQICAPPQKLPGGQREGDRLLRLAKGKNAAKIHIHTPHSMDKTQQPSTQESLGGKWGLGVRLLLRLAAMSVVDTHPDLWSQRPPHCVVYRQRSCVCACVCLKSLLMLPYFAGGRTSHHLQSFGGFLFLVSCHTRSNGRHDVLGQ